MKKASRKALFLSLALAVLFSFSACQSSLTGAVVPDGTPPFGFQPGNPPSDPQGSPSDQPGDFPGEPGTEPGENGDTGSETPADTSPRETPDVTVTPSDETKTGVTTILAAGDTATFTGEGAAVDQDAITINMAGEYEIAGSWTGRILIAVGETDKVTLTLKGFTAACSYDSVIYVASADKVTILCETGSENTITDSDSRAETDSDTRGKAAIYARSSLEITGDGSLTVSSAYKHGISSTKKLTVSGSTLSVTAVDCGLKGNNSVVIEGGVITLNTKGDGIKTEGEDKEDKGFVEIYSGSLTITTAQDGISATRRLAVFGGEITITTTGNDTSSATGGGFGPGGGGGRPGGGWGGGWGGRPGSGTSQPGTSESDSSDISSKGLKAGCDTVGTAALLTVSGGKITVNSTGHALHSTGNVVIEDNADLTLTSSQKGIQGHGEVNISGGRVTVTKSTEGIESKDNMNISGGVITVYATDDGINVGGSGKTLTVSGGTLDVTTATGDTDGIDSNGSIVVTGGFVLVKGGSSMGGMSGSVDADRTVTVTGGTVVALGGICDLPASSSCPAVRFSNKSFSAGDYTVTDGDGKMIFSFSLEGSYRSGWIASDALSAGTSYTLLRGSSQVSSWKQSSSTVSAS